MTDWNPSITAETAARRLHRWGHFLPHDPDRAEREIPRTDWTGGAMREALASFQTMYAAEISQRADRANVSVVKGDLDMATEAMLVTPRCKVSDNLAVAEANWPDPCRDEITYAMLFAALSPLDNADTLRAFTDALRSWTEAMELRLVMDNTLGNQARIWANAGRLSGSTLAWSYLAQNSCAAHLEQRYNTGVTWSLRYLQGVVAHEVGHALGLQHINDQRALLYPYARPEVYLPQELDKQAMERLGYERRTTDPPDPPPPPPPPPPGPVRVTQVDLLYSDGFRQTLRSESGTDWS